jgi:hypothetical protein
MSVGRRVDHEHFDATCFLPPGVLTEAADSPQRNLNVYRHNKFKPSVTTWWSNCISCTALHSVRQFRDYSVVLLKIQVFVTGEAVTGIRRIVSAFVFSVKQS